MFQPVMFYYQRVATSVFSLVVEPSLKNIGSSVGMIILFPIDGEIKVIFQSPTRCFLIGVGWYYQKKKNLKDLLNWKVGHLFKILSSWN